MISTLAEHRLPDRCEVAIELMANICAEGQELFVAHAREGGMVDGMIDGRRIDPDFDLFLTLESRGAAFAVGARSDGELVGYLVFVIAPSLECKGDMIAEQSAFFVREDHRGAGSEMHRIGREELKRRRVNHLVIRASVRGRERLALLAERLGAKYMGKYYYLPLED